MKRFVALLLISFFAFSGSYASAYAQENATTKNESVARDIMGDDIIFPEEVAKARGLVYTEAQLKQLSDTIPTAEVLRWGKEKGYALMPAPPKAMSVLDVFALKVDRKEQGIDGWLNLEFFAHDEKTTFGWLMIKKTPVDNSMGKNWDEQNKLLSEVERVPKVAELVWFATTFFEVRGVRPVEGTKFVRTSSLQSDGFRVDVVYLGTGSVFLSTSKDSDLNDTFGPLRLSSARKLP